jgi:hypothetical protein
VGVGGEEMGEAATEARGGVVVMRVFVPRPVFVSMAVLVAVFMGVPVVMFLVVLPVAHVGPFRCAGVDARRP